jgi:hypothetical protein
MRSMGRQASNPWFGLGDTVGAIVDYLLKTVMRFLTLGLAAAMALQVSALQGRQGILPRSSAAGTSGPTKTA